MSNCHHWQLVLFLFTGISAEVVKVLGEFRLGLIVLESDGSNPFSFVEFVFLNSIKTLDALADSSAAIDRSHGPFDVVIHRFAVGLIRPCCGCERNPQHHGDSHGTGKKQFESHISLLKSKKV